MAAGQFAQVYEQVMLLRSAVGMAAPQATVPALGAAELVGAALEAFAADPELLAAERARIRLLLVDDAQNLDPQAALLVRVLAAGAELAVIAGDPNQSVFGYRGADPALLGDGDAPGRRARRVAPVRTGGRPGRSRASPAGCPVSTTPRHLDGGRGPAGVGGGADRRHGARRIRGDRRRAAPRPPGRRRAVVADGGHRAVGAAGRCGAGARADGGGRARRAAGVPGSARRAPRGRSAADGARRRRPTGSTASARWRC